jgi:hypothetical protein
MTDRTNADATSPRAEHGAILAPSRQPGFGGRAGLHSVDWTDCPLAARYGIPGEDSDQSRHLIHRTSA